MVFRAHISRNGLGRALVSCALLILAAAALSAQDLSLPRTFILNTRTASMEGGGGQIDPSAWRLERFSRLSVYAAISPLGFGVHASTNLSPHLDVRLFENFFPVNHTFTRSDVVVALHIRFANAGVAADYYPFHRPFHISPGLLFYNRNRVNATVKSLPNASLTLNNVDWFSDPANPAYGTGRLDIGGSGPTITAGYGRITSHSEKRWTFPFQAGVAFIETPKASLNLFGNICNANGTNCQPAATYPAFQNALAAQLKTWNSDMAPFHIFPIVEGGVAYTFNIRARSLSRLRQ